jgi:phenylacetic acid degradation operon negative regulatory protein
MRDRKPTPYQEVLDALLGCGPLKTWSLIVTILGDLAQAGDGRLPGPVLSRLTEPLGIRPEALRVAIHRLRRDGWITSERDGRVSVYRLTAHGRTLTQSVAERVYGATIAQPARWHILIGPTAEAVQALDEPGLIQLGARVALLPGDAVGLPASILAWDAQAGALPDWARAAIMPEDLVASYARLCDALDRALAFSSAKTEDAMKRAVLRFLALHQWRRLVLRHGAAVEVLIGPDWDGARCRARITTLLAMLDRPDPAALSVLPKAL